MVLIPGGVFVDWLSGVRFVSDGSIKGVLCTGGVFGARVLPRLLGVIN